MPYVRKLRNCFKYRYSALHAEYPRGGKTAIYPNRPLKRGRFIYTINFQLKILAIFTIMIYNKDIQKVFYCKYVVMFGLGALFACADNTK